MYLPVVEDLVDWMKMVDIWPLQLKESFCLIKMRHTMDSTLLCVVFTSHVFDVHDWLLQH